MRQDNKRNKYDEIRTDSVNGCVMEEEEKLVHDNMCTPAEIIGKTKVIDRCAERRRLKIEKDNVE